MKGIIAGWGRNKENTEPGATLKVTFNLFSLHHLNTVFPLRLLKHFIFVLFKERDIICLSIQELRVPITRDPNECKELPKLKNENNWFCFGGKTNKSGCVGDSGGPVIVRENNR
jgi:hypothetical protein